MRDGRPLGPWPVVAVGGEQPSAVIALRGLDPRRPAQTLAELAVLAAEFRPSRVLVGVTTCDGSRRGTLLVEDVEVVPDGQVELLRAWRWRRVLRRVWWLPVEARHWRVGDTLLSELAQAIIAECPVDHEPDRLRYLVRRHLAAGHRVRLSPGLASRGALPGA